MAAKTAKKAPSKTAAAATIPGAVVLKLSEIQVREGFNARSGNWASDSGNEESQVNDWPEFVSSFRDRGQDTPVTVRAGKRGKYELIAGHRRFAALSEIAAENGDKDATIFAIVRELDDLDAVRAAARENSERQDLKPADLTYQVGQLSVEYAKKGEKATQTQIGADIGRKQTYAGKLLKIWNDLDRSIFEEWRSLSADVSVLKVYAIAGLPKDKQAEAWEKAKKPTASAGGQGRPSEESKAAKRVERLKKQARELGVTLGRLEYAEQILQSEDWSPATIVKMFLALNEDEKAGQYSKAFRDGFNEGKRAEAADEVEDDEDES